MSERHIDRLVKRAIRGDTEAFGVLYDLHVNRVYTFVLSRVGDVHEAEDITETTFVKAFEGIRTYRRRGLPFGAWLFRVARNATIDHVRKSARIPDPMDTTDVELADTQRPFDESVIASVDGERVREAVRALTEDQAAVIACRFFWDMDIRQTARAVGKTEGAVKALQHRAMESLARLLGGAEHE